MVKHFLTAVGISILLIPYMTQPILTSHTESSKPHYFFENLYDKGLLNTISEPSSTPESTITPTETPVASEIIEETLTPIPTLTPTEIPTITPMPTSTEIPSAAPTVTPTPSYTIEKLDQKMYATTDVNIRTLPTTKGEKLSVLSKGNEILVTGKCVETGWYQVSYKNNIAYISHKYLTTAAPKPESNGEKIIYLTFDDGPSKHTGELLEILDKYNVKATFFVVTYKKSYEHFIKEAYEKGHTIAIHTASHNYEKIYANEEAYFKDLYKAQDYLYNLIGVRSNIIRFPGGSSNKVSIKYNKGIMTRLTKAVEEAGFTYYDWNIDSDDANGGSNSTEDIIKKVTTSIAKRKVAVVLQHDTRKFSVDAVESIILWGLENGYNFKPLAADSVVTHHRINN